jgi:hypothetical protein
VNSLKKAMYMLPLLVASTFLPINEAKGQNTDWSPSGEIQMFLSRDTTPQGKAFNMTPLKQLDDTIQTRFDKYNYLVNTDYFDCSQKMKGIQALAIEELSNPTPYYDDVLLFNNYFGTDPVLITANGGTLHNRGKMGVPVARLDIYDPVNRDPGHTEPIIPTGNDLTEWESWCAVEPRNNRMYVQPGEENTPLDCERLIIYYPYLYSNEKHERNLAMIRVLEFQSVQGKVTLTYNINNDWVFKDLCHLIEKRDTTIADINMDVKGNMLTVDIKEDNPRTMYWTVDDGKTKNPITQLKQTIDMGIKTDGEHTVQVYVDDYFDLSNTKSKTTNIDATAPIINTYLNNTSDTISWNILEDHFKNAYYMLDDKTAQTPINQTGKVAIKDLGLTNGSHTINFYAKDSADNIGTNSENFSFATSTNEQTQSAKYTAYPNPVQDNITFTYPENTNATIKLFDMSGKQLETIIDNDKNGETQYNLINYTPAAYLYQIITSDNSSTKNPTQTYNGKLIKE